MNNYLKKALNMVRFVARGDSSRLGEFHDVQNHPNSGLVMQPRSLPFASLNFGVKSSDHDSNGTNGHKVIEKRTGIEFPYEFCFRRSFGRCPQITGAGARTKRIAGIKSLDIYALALYVDKKELKNNLGRKFGRRLPEQLANDQDLFDELVKAQNVEKSLVIKITSGLVKRGNFLVALNERLSPPLKRLGQDEVIKSFESQFDSVSFRKWMSILQSRRRGCL